MKKAQIVLLIATVFLFISCTQKKETVELTIIQTTDVHGTLFPYDFIKDKPMDNSLASVQAFVKEAREENPGGVLLFDNGDLLQGQPTVYYYNFEDTLAPHLAASVLNYMQYDVATVGNHDIETGHSVYDRFNEQLDFPYLAANAIDIKTGNPYFDPYAIVERQGIKVAILGLITPGIPQWLPENLWEGITFIDMIESAQHWLPIIQKQEKPDLIIGLFHSGVDHTYGNAGDETYLNENATKLVAEQVPGFDIVMAGHDHKYYNEKLVNVAGDTVFLIDPRSHARAVGMVKAQFTYNEETKSYDKHLQSDIVDITKYPADSAFMSNFSSEYNQITNYVKRPIGEFTASISSKDAFFGNSAFMDFIHNIQLEISGAQISFASPLSMNSEIKEGTLYVSDLFKLYKFENMLYTMQLSGKEIDAYLEYSSNLWFNTMQNSKDHLLKIKEKDGKYRFTNPYYNFSSASGINYTIDVSKAEGDRVEISSLSSGGEFFADSTYSVAINSYRGNGGGGHLSKGAGIDKDGINARIKHSTDKDLRYYMMKWIEEEGSVTAEKGNNWQIIPNNYFEKGMSRDKALLYSRK